MVKRTFTFDDDTVARLRQTAARLRKPQSYVVRQAVRDYAERVGNLSEEERRHLLDVFDRLVPAIPTRPAAEVREEILGVRAARRRAARPTRFRRR